MFFMIIMTLGSGKGYTLILSPAPRSIWCETTSLTQTIAKVEKTANSFTYSLLLLKGYMRQGKGIFLSCRIF